MKLRPKKWEEFQHYKDRCPPWIKLQKTLLDDYEFQSLHVASRALAPMLWLLASESTDGVFDADIDRLAFRLRTDKKELAYALKELIHKGFFVVASGVLAECLRDAMPETETETETEKPLSGKPDESEKSPKRKLFNPELFEAFWKNWPATDRRTQKAKCFAKWKLEKLNDKAETIQAHVTALKRTEKWRNGFEPAPLTYLNGKQWEDGLPEVERQSAKEANDPIYQSLVEKFGSAKRRPDGRIYAGGRIFNADGSGGLCL